MATTVGVKELKNRLSHYLRLVAAGARIVVTDHGRPIAELGPPPGVDDPWSEPFWIRLAAKGLVTLPRRRGPFPRVRSIRLKGGATLSDAVIEDRR